MYFLHPLHYTSSVGTSISVSLYLSRHPFLAVRVYHRHKRATVPILFGFRIRFHFRFKCWMFVCGKWFTILPKVNESISLVFFSVLLLLLYSTVAISFRPVYSFAKIENDIDMLFDEKRNSRINAATHSINHYRLWQTNDRLAALLPLATAILFRHFPQEKRSRHYSRDADSTSIPALPFISHRHCPLRLRRCRYVYCAYRSVVLLQLILQTLKR